ncbi:MAG: SdpI family protein [Putridiphycobacter sp.]
MKFELKKEIPAILIAILPFVYLAFVWNTLPDEVPIHWNAKGEIDGWGSKYSLVWLSGLLTLLLYFIFLLVPFIDPKKKLAQMGGKFHSFKLVLLGFMSILSIYIIYSAASAELTNPGFITALVGVMFVVMGNYMKTIKPNYFLGIRTPWTLENEQVWRSTHELASKLWFVGGLLVMVSSFLLPPFANMFVMIGIIAVITLVPIIYSYRLFQKLKG